MVLVLLLNTNNAIAKIKKKSIKFSTTPLSIINTDANLQLNAELQPFDKKFGIFTSTAFHLNSYSPLLNGAEVYNRKHWGLEFTLNPRYYLKKTFYVGALGKFKNLKTEGEAWTSVLNGTAQQLTFRNYKKQRGVFAFNLGFTGNHLNDKLFTELDLSLGAAKKQFFENNTKVLRPSDSFFLLEAFSGTFPYLGVSFRVGFRF